jgi:hypothetical protein
MALVADIPVDYTIARNPPPTYRGGPDGRAATITFQVAINDATAFVQHAIGTVELIDHGDGITTERVVPLIYPDDPEMHLVAYDVEYFGTPNGSGWSFFTNQFSHARILCEFATLPFPTGGGDTPFYTLTADYGTSIETIPGSVWRFPSDNSTLSGEGGLFTGVVSFTLTQFLSRTPIPYSVLSMVGSVNSVAWGIFPIGTLRFDGAQSQYAKGMFSETLVKSYSLKFRPRPWREVLRANGVWEEPVLGGTSNKKYSAANLKVLAYL